MISIRVRVLGKFPSEAIILEPVRVHLKRMTKFENLDYRLRTAEDDLEFSLRCRESKIIPIF